MATSPTTKVTQRIDAYRRLKGVSEQKLSTDSRIPLATLRRRLKHDDLITLVQLHAISAALGVEPIFWDTDFETARAVAA